MRGVRRGRWLRSAGSLGVAAGRFGAGRQISADFLGDVYFLFRGAHPFFYLWGRLGGRGCWRGAVGGLAGAGRWAFGGVAGRRGAVVRVSLVGWFFAL